MINLRGWTNNKQVRKNSDSVFCSPRDFRSHLPLTKSKNWFLSIKYKRNTPDIIYISTSLIFMTKALTYRYAKPKAILFLHQWDRNEILRKWNKREFKIEQFKIFERNLYAWAIFNRHSSEPSVDNSRN